MSKIILIISAFLFSTQSFAESSFDASANDECLAKAVDEVAKYLQKDNPGTDIWKSVSKDQFIGLFDANKVIGSFTLTDIVEEEFQQTVIFTADDSDYIVFVSYGWDEESGECKVGKVDGGQNDND